MNTSGLVVVDVQPAYHFCCAHIARDVARRINNTRKPVVIVWVGEGFTSDTEDDVRHYLHEAGARPSRLAACRYLEKDYGFFRGWMDYGVARETIVSVGTEMMRSGRHDSESLDLAAFLGPEEVDRLPAFDHLRRPCFDNTTLRLLDSVETCGGGENECLAEFELYLAMTGKPYTRLENLVY